MKSLIDKIIGLIEEQANGQYNEFAKKQLLIVAGRVKEAEQNAEFEEIARVMMKHLANPVKYHPHHRVVIDSTNAELLEGKESTGRVMDYITD